jgi:predicted NBD/HSP70 family sugar kinase
MSRECGRESISAVAKSSSSPSTPPAASAAPAHSHSARGARSRARRSTLARYEERLTRGLAHVINVLDPDVILLGGGLSNLDRLNEYVLRLWSR